MTKPKPNAVLEWRGRKLMCNGVCVAEIHDYSSDVRPSRFAVYIGDPCKLTERCSEASARRAVNRRFGLAAEYGAKP